MLDTAWLHYSAHSAEHQVLDTAWLRQLVRSAEPIEEDLLSVERYQEFFVQNHPEVMIQVIQKECFVVFRP